MWYNLHVIIQNEYCLNKFEKTMPLNNLISGINANSAEMRLFLDSTIHNKGIIGFMFGLLTTVIIIGFIITKNPKHIPAMLRYSSMESFQRIAARDKNGTYQMAFSKFVKIYTEIRTLFAVAFISFCVMIITILLTQK